MLILSMLARASLSALAISHVQQPVAVGASPTPNAATTVAITVAAHGPGARARAAARDWWMHNERAIVGEFAALLALPNLASDSAAIRRNADTLVAMLRRRGASDTRLLIVPGGPPAVYGELRAPGAARTVILYAHYDGQPLDPAQWSNPPWQPRLRPAPAADAPNFDPDTRIYARSAGDDKGSIMAMLAAVDAMRAHDVARSVNVKFFFEGEEEAGSGHLGAILAANSALLTADALLFCDGPVHQSGRQQLIFGQRGVTGFELALYGANRALHSGHYGNWAPNPAARLATLLASMRDDDGRILIDGYYDDVAPISAAERRAIAALPAYDATLREALALDSTEEGDAPLAERIMLPALNIRGLRAGGVRETGSNTIATVAYASVDLRLVPHQDPARVRRLVEAHLAKRGYWVTHDSVTDAMRRAHARVARIQWESGYPASRTPLDGAFGRAVLAAIDDGARAPALVFPTFGGSGPAYLFEQLLHVPVITLPIANYDDNQHAADENLRIGNLWDGIETFAGVLAALGGEWR